MCGVDTDELSVTCGVDTDELLMRVSHSYYCSWHNYPAIGCCFVIIQSNVTYPDATYPSTSDIQQWAVLHNFNSLTYNT